MCTDCKRLRESKAGPAMLDPPKFLQKLEGTSSLIVQYWLFDKNILIALQSAN